MIHHTIAIASIVASSCIAMPAVAQDAEADLLFEALGLPDIIDIMREEGVAYGAQIGTDLFPNQVTPAWSATVETIYDAEAMHASVKAAFIHALDDQDVTPMVAFFTSDLGETLVSLEVGARRALLDDAVGQASKDAATRARNDNSERFQLVDAFVQANDLIETNVVGAMNSNVAFYSGLMAGGAFDEALTQDQILNDVWDQEADIRANTSEWVYGFLLLAYDPVSAEALESYTEFSASDTGAVLNGALFAAFDDMFDAISFALGREAARVMGGQDL
ncbi:MAG: DUF2059 domain-containing protein [Yoonia sp.]|nr:DUF2059 domain-containing protein [Yoonia sp.]